MIKKIIKCLFSKTEISGYLDKNNNFHETKKSRDYANYRIERSQLDYIYEKNIKQIYNSGLHDNAKLGKLSIENVKTTFKDFVDKYYLELIHEMLKYDENLKALDKKYGY